MHQVFGLTRYLLKFRLNKTFILRIIYWRIVINLCLGIYIAQSEDEEFSIVDAV